MRMVVLHNINHSLGGKTMNASIQQYIKRRRKEMITEAGLYQYKKIYYSEEDNDNINDFPYTEKKYVNGIPTILRYKMVETEFTDEDYEEFIKYYKPQTTKISRIPKILTILAWVTYVAVFVTVILSLVLKFSLVNMLSILVSGFIEGTVLLGLAKIINLLETIANK